MKFFLRLSLFFFLGIGVLVTSAESQSLSIISCDTLVTDVVLPESESQQLTAKAVLKNVSFADVKVMTKVNYIQKSQGHTYQFCDFNSCYPGDNKDESATTLPFNLTKDQTTGNFIHLYLQPNGNTGISKFRMTFYVQNNVNDSVSFNVTFIVTLTSVIDMLTYDNNSFSIYPNPANNVIKFNYLLPSDNLKSKIEIFNSEGALINTIENSTTASLDLSRYSSGVYFSKLSINNQAQTTKKFIVTH